MALKTTEVIENLVKDTVETMGYTLEEITFQKEYGNWTLTLYIDKENGVTIDDCESVSKAVDPILDESDPIPQAYYLSVSSIGLDHPIKKDSDFKRNLNKEISVKLYAPMDGKKDFEGVLIEYDEKTFTIYTENENKKIERKEAALIKPVIRFD